MLPRAGLGSNKGQIPLRHPTRELLADQLQTGLRPGRDSSNLFATDRKPGLRPARELDGVTALNAAVRQLSVDTVERDSCEERRAVSDWRVWSVVLLHPGERA